MRLEGIGFSDYSSTRLPTPFLSRIIFLDLRLAPWTMHAYQDNKIDGQVPFTCEAFNGFFYDQVSSFAGFFFLPGIIFLVGFPGFMIAFLIFLFFLGGGAICPLGSKTIHIIVGPYPLFGFALHYLEYSYGI